jgi:hypothetical protein
MYQHMRPVLSSLDNYAHIGIVWIICESVFVCNDHGPGTNESLRIYPGHSPSAQCITTVSSAARTGHWPVIRCWLRVIWVDTRARSVYLINTKHIIVLPWWNKCINVDIVHINVNHLHQNKIYYWDKINCSSHIWLFPSPSLNNSNSE